MCRPQDDAFVRYAGVTLASAIVVGGFVGLLLGAEIGESNLTPIGMSLPRVHALSESLTEVFENLTRGSRAPVDSVGVYLHVAYRYGVRLVSSLVQVGAKVLTVAWWNSSTGGSDGSVEISVACIPPGQCPVRWTAEASYTRVDLSDGTRLTTGGVWAMPELT